MKNVVNLRSKISVGLTLSICLVQMAFGQEGGFNLGPFDVSPSLVVGVESDDNIFRQSEDETSDTITTINPSLNGAFDNGVSGVSFAYSAVVVNYQSDDRQDSISQSGNLLFGWSPVNNHRISIGGDVSYSSSARSADSASGVDSAELDQTAARNYSIEYIYGGDSALWQFNLLAANGDFAFTTNEAVNARNDRKTNTIEFGLQRDIAVGVDFFGRAGQSEVDFSNDSSRSSENQFFSLGFNWQSAATYNVSLGLGQNKRTLNEGSQGSFSSESIDLSVNWRPLSYTFFDVAVARSLEEDDSAAAASFVEVTSANLSWVHNWTEVISSSTSYLRQNTEFKGTFRKDESNTISLGVAYKLKQWLNSELSISQESQSGKGQDETLTPDYERNAIGLRVTAVL